jgi:rhodanese-related sulfurtransferase
VALVLREMGVHDAYALAGGYAAWQARNYPVATGERPR